MTTARRAQTCASCGFANDDIIHYRNCVPTSQWPRDLRDRKAAAMNHAIPEDVEWEPEPVKPQGITEYRRLHPEANPLTTETMKVMESRKRQDGGTDTWERVVGVKEAMSKVGPCPRCSRPLLDRSMHITCKPVDGSVITDAGPRNPLKRDDVPLTPRHPVIHTTAEVRTGSSWYDALAEAEEPAVDEEELQDFLALDSLTPDEAAAQYTIEVDPEVLAKVIAEQEAWVPPLIVTGDPNADTSQVVTVAPIEAADYAAPDTAPRLCECGYLAATIPGLKVHRTRKHKGEA